MPGPSPIARQRELGTKLRSLRNEHGMTVEEVAEQLLCSATKISRLEPRHDARACGTSAICAFSTKSTSRPRPSS